MTDTIQSISLSVVLIQNWLSFSRAEDRCRHYMVEQTVAGKYIIIGEPKVHRTLQDLVKFHQEVNDYDLLFPMGNPAILKIASFPALLTPTISNYQGCRFISPRPLLFLAVLDYDFSFQYPLSNWNGVLTEPCGQEDGQCDYWDLTEVIGLIPTGPHNTQYNPDTRVSTLTS